MLDTLTLAVAVAGAAVNLALLCVARRRAVPLAIPAGAVVLILVVLGLSQPRRMEETHMAKSAPKAKSKTAAKPAPHPREQYRPPAGMRGAELAAFKEAILKKLKLKG